MTNVIHKTILSAISFMFMMLTSQASFADNNPFGVSDKPLSNDVQLAEKMKCGAGKCGDSMKKKDGMKCGDSMKKKAEKKAKCGAEHMKEQGGKCGASMDKKTKKMDKKEGKCGTGKCGANK